MSRSAAFRNCIAQRQAPVMALSDVVIRRAGSKTNQALSLRRVPLTDPGAGNVYEAGGVQLQFRALLQGRPSEPGGRSSGEPMSERWSVAVREPAAQPGAAWRAACMRPRGASSNVWALDFADPALASYEIDLGANDPLALAAYDAHLPFEEDSRLEGSGPRFTGDPADGAARLSRVAAEFPFWPEAVTRPLAQSGLRGAGAVVYHADTFLEMLYTSAFPGPVLFPHAAYRLQARLGRVMAAVSGLLGSPARADAQGCAVGDALLGAVGEQGLAELGGGRLTALLADEGGLCQVGDGLSEGLREAGAVPVEVEFPGPPMGIGLGPACEDEVGMLVTEVDEGSPAEAAGVKEGWVVTNINGEDVTALDFWDADARFDEPPPWRVVFDPDLNASNFYVVELPAAELIERLAGNGAEEGAEAGAELQAQCTEAAGGVPAFVWQESFARLFLGDPGSMTCLHVDLLPQLEFCHMLAGSKVLGASSWSRTPALLERYGGTAGPTGASAGVVQDDEEYNDDGGDEEETHPAYVPCDQPLMPLQKELLSEPSMSLAFAQSGDLVVFSSAAAHFATNGATRPSAALFHGALSPASVHRLCADVAASRDPFTEEERSGEYSNHLTAAELVREYALSAPAGIMQASELMAKLEAAIANGPSSGSLCWASESGKTSLEVLALTARYRECLDAMEKALTAARDGTLPPWAGESLPSGLNGMAPDTNIM